MATRKMKRPILAPTQFARIPNWQLRQGLEGLLTMRENGQYSGQLKGAMQLTIQEMNWRQFGGKPKFFFYWHYATQYRVYKAGRVNRAKRAGQWRVEFTEKRKQERRRSILNYIENHLN